MKIVMVLLLLCALIGCSGSEQAKGLAASLTLAEWQQMDEASKYELDTLERLKESVPEYRDDQKWQQFLVEEVVPNMNQFDSTKDKTILIINVKKEFYVAKNRFTFDSRGTADDFVERSSRALFVRLR